MKVMFDSFKSSSSFFCGKKVNKEIGQNVDLEPKTINNGLSNDQIYNGLMSFKNTIGILIPVQKVDDKATLNVIA